MPMPELFTASQRPARGPRVAWNANFTEGLRMRLKVYLESRADEVVMMDALWPIIMGMSILRLGRWRRTS